MKLKKMKKQKAFTLIELLVVISIVSILASILFVAIDPKGQADETKDVKRMAFVKQLTGSLERYYLDKGYYPKTRFATYGDTGGSSARFFEDELRDYMNIDFTQKFLYGWGIPEIHETSFLYQSSDHDDYKTYGIGIILKKHYNLSGSDGGYYSSYYEIGIRPKYCRNKYGGTDGNWWTSSDSICAGGN